MELFSADSASGRFFAPPGKSIEFHHGIVMKKPPLLSVITVVRNDLPGLVATSESLLRQTDRDFEWIVVDGASSDGCVAFLESFQSMPLLWRSEPDRGIYDAMNKGTRLARGEFVIYLNAGDSFREPDCVSAISQALRSDLKPDLLCCGAFYVYGEQSILRRPRRLESSIWHTVPSVHQAMVFRREFLDDPPYDLSYPVSADYFLAARCFVKGARVAYLDSRVVDFTLGGSSSRHKWGSLKDMLRIQRRILKQGWPLCLVSALRRVASQTAVQLIVYWGNLRRGIAGPANDDAAPSAESQPQALCGNRPRIAEEANHG